MTNINKHLKHQRLTETTAFGVIKMAKKMSAVSQANGGQSMLLIGKREWRNYRPLEGMMKRFNKY